MPSESGAKACKAFTLIELLVAIAIIGLLAAVILAGLSESKKRGADASIRSETRELATVLQLEYTANNGSYANLQTADDSVPWLLNAADCDGAFAASSYASNARDICKTIVGQVGGTAGQNGLYIGVTGNPYLYSIMVYLPGKKTWLCLSSTGATSDITASPGTKYNGKVWGASGCINNP